MWSSGICICRWGCFAERCLRESVCVGFKSLIMFYWIIIGMDNSFQQIVSIVKNSSEEAIKASVIKEVKCVWKSKERVSCA